ncbi:MAG: ABC transporter ATP-binding protein/permease [Oscillospiraceae bacterium]|nr:ABC transporter ATP-binding protein/permease [Oscillospiraceae bacterium]
MEERSSSRTQYRQLRTARPEDLKGTIRRILQYMMQRKNLLILTTCCIIISCLANIASSYFFKPIINDYVLPYIGQDNPELSGFVTLLIIMGAVYIVGACSTYIYRFSMSKVSTGTLYQMRSDVFASLQDMPIQYYDQRTHGELMSVFSTDVDTMRQMLSETFPQFVNTIVNIIGITTMMLILSPPLTVISLCMLVLMVTIMVKLASKSGEYFRKIQRYAGNLNGYAEEMIEGQRVVKVFSHEKHSKAVFGEIVVDMFEAGVRANTFSSMLMPITMNLSYTLYAITAAVGAYLAIQGKLDLGSLASFLLYNRMFAGPISQLSMQFNYVMMAMAGAERVFRVIDSRPELDEGTARLVNVIVKDDGTLEEVEQRTNIWAWKYMDELRRVEGHVQFKNVTFAYERDHTILNDISLEALPAQKIALVGSTGAGKTTITNLINRFYDISDGQILYDGIDIKDIKKDDLRRSLGVVLQDTNLFSGTVTDNIRFGNINATDQEVVDAAKLANADSFIRRLPDGYNTELSSNGGNLSQGQRQLLNISRAAVSGPPVLILDEATSSVDTRTEHLVQRGMDQLMEGRTTFLIAHRLSTIRHADQIIVLEHGSIVESGTHEELLTLKGRYYQLYTGMLELE